MKLTIKPIDFKRDLEYIYSTYEDLFSLNIPDFEFTKKGYNNFKKEILGVKGKKNFKIFVLKENNVQIGYVQVKIQIMELKGKNNLIVSKLYIDKDKRNLGYGKKLMEFVKEYAKERKCVIINLNTFENNLEIYKKMGFEPISYWMQMSVN